MFACLTEDGSSFKNGFTRQIGLSCALSSFRRDVYVQDKMKLSLAGVIMCAIKLTKYVVHFYANSREAGVLHN